MQVFPDWTASPTPRVIALHERERWISRVTAVPLFNLFVRIRPSAAFIGAKTVSQRLQSVDSEVRD